MEATESNDQQQVFSSICHTKSQFTLSESNGLMYKPHPLFLAQNLSKKVRLIYESLRYHVASYLDSFLSCIYHLLRTTYRTPRTEHQILCSQLLRKLPLLYMYIHVSLTVYCVAGYEEVSSSGRVFCSYSMNRKQPKLI